MNKLARLAFWGWIALLSLGVITEKIDHPTDKSVVSLDFQEIDVRKALQILAKFTQLNLIIEGTVQGKISLHLSQVPAEEALQAILKLQNLTQQKTKNTRIIRPNNTVESTAAAKQDPLLETKQIIIRHREAKEIGALFLGNQGRKTPSSALTVDARSNSLWIRDTPDRIKDLEKLVSTFDLMVQQVLIEARVVSINRHSNRSLGVRLGLKPFSSATTTIKEGADATESTDDSSGVTLFPLNLDLPSLRQTLNNVAPVLWTGFNRLLDLELAAMENEGHGRIISSPHLMTTDRTPAIIEAGSEIPYQEKHRYGNSIAFKKAVLSLQVTPEITPSGHILLKLELNHDKPGTPSVENTPAIDTQKLRTQVLVKSGETVGLGGIYETVSQESRYRVPGLGSIPILSWFFSQRGQLNTTRELLVFVTPHVVSDTFLKQRHHDTLPS